MQARDRTASSYDAMAEAYAARYGDELAHKPLDRALLQAFAEQLRTEEQTAPPVVADVGCGPGHVAHFLAGLGVDVCGVDLSPAMCALARARNPGATVYEASMDALPVLDATWAGIVAFYSLCHIATGELTAVVREFDRVLRPGGLLLLAFHGGNEVHHVDEELGVAVDLDFHFHSTVTVNEALRNAGMRVQAVMERDAYQPSEVDTRRVYIQARKPLLLGPR